MADYVKQTWVDGADTTPINADRLGHMEDGIELASRQFHVGPTNQLPPGQAGAWFQTFEDGSFTLWIEDGT